jgi:DNA-binding beta-propeller fold protein YncE/mono/diheme cytochrome c family protein
MLLKHGWLIGMTVWLSACGDAPTLTTVDAPPETSAAPIDAPAPRIPAATREGGALSRSPKGDALYLADEDHSSLRRIPLPVDVNNLGAEMPSPGKPAQVLALDDKVLMTVRDPGKLVVWSTAPAPELVREVALPADAWGIAVSPDEDIAYVTSAWSHKVSAVHIDDGRVLWTVDVAREPRGITVNRSGTGLYVSHLVGSDITKIDNIQSGAPKVVRLPLPPDPGRTMYRYSLTASLGYAITMAPDGERLYASRRALGTLGWSNWQGTGTLDVLITKDDTPLFPARTSPPFGTISEEGLTQDGDAAGAFLAVGTEAPRVPRAMIYRKKTDTILIASEDDDKVSELDATSISPQNAVLATYQPGKPAQGSTIIVNEHCGAPTGLALSEDEDMLWVWCRTTDELAILRLDPRPGRRPGERGPIPIVSLRSKEPETVNAKMELGKRLFFNGTDPIVSGGLSCAGCHPEGRDDGFTWFELDRPSSRFASLTDKRTFLAGTTAMRFMFYGDESAEKDAKLYARQTPMLAGRVDAQGPYGWHAESPTLERRVREGFALHRWDPGVAADVKALKQRSEAIAEFLRRGLTPPPMSTRELTAQEKEGETLFRSSKTECATCHDPAREFTDRSKVALAQGKPGFGFNEDPDLGFKTPSLRFVSGSAPYFHDGSAATLEDVVEKNYDRMGKTTALKAEERAALVAYLKTL